MESTEGAVLSVSDGAGVALLAAARPAEWTSIILVRFKSAGPAGMTHRPHLGQALAHTMCRWSSQTRVQPLLCHAAASYSQRPQHGPKQMQGTGTSAAWQSWQSHPLCRLRLSWRQWAGCCGKPGKRRRGQLCSVQAWEGQCSEQTHPGQHTRDASCKAVSENNAHDWSKQMCNVTA